MMADTPALDRPSTGSSSYSSFDYGFDVYDTPLAKMAGTNFSKLVGAAESPNQTYLQSSQMSFSHTNSISKTASPPSILAMSSGSTQAPSIAITPKNTADPYTHNNETRIKKRRNQRKRIPRSGVIQHRTLFRGMKQPYVMFWLKSVIR